MIRAVTATFLSSATDSWGAEESLLTLAASLVENSVEPHLWSANPSLLDRWQTDVGNTGRLIPSRGQPRIAQAREWARLLRTAHTDVSIVFSIDLAPLSLLHRSSSHPFVLDLHDYLPTASGRAKLWAAARRYRSVIAISEFSASQVRPHPRVDVVRRPIKPPVTTRHPSAPVNGSIGVVGRLDPDKCVEVALDAMELLPQDVRLTVKGAPSAAHEGYARSLRDYARVRFGERVDFTGRVDPRDVMSDLDVLVVANSREALGRTVLEAQLSGVVVVAPASGGTAELVRHGATGFTYSPKDPRALAAAVELALEAGEGVRSAAMEEAQATTDPRLYARRYAEILHGSVRRGARD